MASGEWGLHRVERVRQRGRDLVRMQIGRAGFDVVVVRLEPFVIVGRDSVAEDVNRLGLAGEAGGQLLGDEAVGTAVELLASS